MRRRAVVWIASLLGIAVSAAVAWSATLLASQHIGLSSEPLSVAAGLAPRHPAAPAARPGTRAKGHRTTPGHEPILPQSAVTLPVPPAPAAGSSSAPPPRASTASAPANAPPATVSTPAPAAKASSHQHQRDDSGGGGGSAGSGGSGDSQPGPDD